MPIDTLLPPDVASSSANTLPSMEEQESMTKRRFQNPKPQREGLWWYLRPRNDVFVDGKLVRKQTRIKLAPASKGLREVQKIAEEIVRPLNQGFITIGSATNFAHYVKDTYLPTVLALRARNVQKSYRGMLNKYINPAFGEATLGEMTPVTLQKYFSSMQDRIPFPTISKIRDALSSVLRSAVKYKYLTTNPMEGLELPPDNRGDQAKPFIYPAEFEAIVSLISEPYATMVYVAVWTGLRVSELSALKWRNIQEDSITIERSYSRGAWKNTKTKGSAATICVDPQVINRIHRLKSLEVEIAWGGNGSKKRLRVVKSDGPDDLVFQSVVLGRPMNEENILRRHIKPAADALKLAVNWRCLRTSCATWMVRAGADPKSVQGQMRHSRISTTMDIYAQFVPAGQRRAVEQMHEFARKSVEEAQLMVQ